MVSSEATAEAVSEILRHRRAAEANANRHGDTNRGSARRAEALAQFVRAHASKDIRVSSTGSPRGRLSGTRRSRSRSPRGWSSSSSSSSRSSSSSASSSSADRRRRHLHKKRSGGEDFEPVPFSVVMDAAKRRDVAHQFQRQSIRTFSRLEHVQAMADRTLAQVDVLAPVTTITTSRAAEAGARTPGEAQQPLQRRSQTVGSTPKSAKKTSTPSKRRK